VKNISLKRVLGSAIYHNFTPDAILETID
jgi:hypothetical protein